MPRWATGVPPNRLFCLTQAPKRLKVGLMVYELCNTSIIYSCLHYCFEKGTDVFLEHPLLDSLDKVIIVFQIPLSPVAFSPEEAAKE